MNCLILGTVAHDVIHTPEITKDDIILGGSAAYASVVASCFMDNVSIVSVIGEDFKKKNITLFSEKNIGVSGIEVVSGGKTFFWKGVYHENFNVRDTIETQLNVLEEYVPFVPENQRTPDVLVLGNFSPDVQKKVLKQIEKKPQVVITDSMNLWINIALDELKEVIAQTDILCLNDSEATQLAEESSLKKTAEKILKMGPKYLIIKKGDNGALLFDGVNTFFCPAILLDKVIDPTGAGDCFLGGVASSLAMQKEVSFGSIKKALLTGTVMASFCVEALGLQNIVDIPQEKIDERLKQLQEMMI